MKLLKTLQTVPKRILFNEIGFSSTTINSFESIEGYLRSSKDLKATKSFSRYTFTKHVKKFVLE